LGQERVLCRNYFTLSPVHTPDVVGGTWTRARQEKEGDGIMLGWALTFLVVAIIAAFFGFGGIAVASAGIAKLLFFVFLVLFAVTLLAGLIRGRPLA
jgi:uncharacterized membrane protein YtjA (UPF0391 family)